MKEQEKDQNGNVVIHYTLTEHLIRYTAARLIGCAWHTLDVMHGQRLHRIVPFVDDLVLKQTYPEASISEQCRECCNLLLVVQHISPDG